MLSALTELVMRLTNAAEAHTNCRLTMSRGRSALLHSLASCMTYMSVSAAQRPWQTDSDASSSTSEPSLTLVPQSSMMPQTAHQNFEEGRTHTPITGTHTCTKPSICKGACRDSFPVFSCSQIIIAA